MDCTISIVSGSEVREHGKSSISGKVSPEVKDVKQTESGQSLMGKSKHRQDFIKKNIEVCNLFKRLNKGFTSKKFGEKNS